MKEGPDQLGRIDGNFITTAPVSRHRHRYFKSEEDFTAGHI